MAISKDSANVHSGGLHWAAVGGREKREQLEKSKRKESLKLQLHRKTMRPMEVESRKEMTGRMMMREEKGERKLEDLDLKGIFKFSLT